jgi:Na+-transporting NADH:ubiquinone oxidoreductase subunit B
MNWIRQKIDQIKEPFEPGNKLEKYRPAINALDTFLFVPDHTTKKGAHIRDAVDLKRTMITVVLALVPALLFGMWNTGYQHFTQLGENPAILEAFLHGAYKIVPMIVVSYAVGLGLEFAFAIMRGHEVNEGYLVTGLLIPMIMPVDIPLWMVALSVIFAVLIGKEAFGGTGMNILNPALTARAFAYFAYPTYMSGNKVWVSEASNIDSISGETILGSLSANKDIAYSSAEMFTGIIPGSIAETSVLCIIAGALILVFTKVADWRIILSGILGAAAMGLLLNALPSLGVEGNGMTNFEWYNHLIVGGFAFGIVFMATDPVSAAQTMKGKWVYGALIGVIAIIIRTLNPAYPEGIMLAILLLNVFAPTIDHYVIQGNIKKRQKRLSMKTVKTA